MMSDPRAPHRYPQLTLGTLLLIVTLVGALLGWFRTRQQVAQVQQQVTALRQLARELQVDDPTQIFVVSRLPTLSGEHIAEFYVPPGDSGRPSHRLCLALEGIVGSASMSPSFPQPCDSLPLASGRHYVEIRHVSADMSDPKDQHEIEILLDDKIVLQAVRPTAWQPSSGWTSTGSYPESKQFDPLEPVELHRRRFNEPIVSDSRSVGDDKPANGILLWIEPLDPSTDLPDLSESHE